MVDDLDRVAVPAGRQRRRGGLEGDLLHVAGVERARVVIVGRSDRAVKRQGGADLGRDRRRALSVFSAMMIGSGFAVSES